MRNPSVERVAFSVAEVSNLTGLGKTKLYELIASGELGSRKIGRRRLIPATDLDRLLGGDDDR